jgi:hypothetical protein
VTWGRDAPLYNVGEAGLGAPKGLSQRLLRLPDGPRQPCAAFSDSCACGRDVWGRRYMLGVLCARAVQEWGGNMYGDVRGRRARARCAGLARVGAPARRGRGSGCWPPAGPDLRRTTAGRATLHVPHTTVSRCGVSLYRVQRRCASQRRGGPVGVGKKRAGSSTMTSSRLRSTPTCRPRHSAAAPVTPTPSLRAQQSGRVKL